MRRICSRPISELPESEYLATNWRTSPPANSAIVDKMPANALFAGLIHLMLPNARMILCRRNPFDTCFSCYSTLFAGRQNFSYDLQELGRYYRAHDALMAHWRRVLPQENFLTIDYEDVVEDIEGTARRLIAFCGLDWSDECLRFHESTRPVRTASMLQVRKPLYRGSVRRWRPFRAELEPFWTPLPCPFPIERKARAFATAKTPHDVGLPSVAGDDGHSFKLQRGNPHALSE